MVQEIAGKILGSLDARVGTSKYTLRQLILRVKNMDQVTKKYYPQLFYDVDKVGTSSTTRFIFFRFLEEQAILAAENILAVLIRNFGTDIGLQELFSHRAQNQALTYTWSNSMMKPICKAQKHGRYDLPEICTLMCKDSDEESSLSDDVSQSDEDAKVEQ